MGGRGVIPMGRAIDDNNKDGFEDWGGYMGAKRAKLLDQFHSEDIEKISNIFQGVAIHTNGLTRPPADELKKLMAAHGGVFHMYQTSSTTHIIASNLPNVKIKHLGTVPVVKPSWIMESIALGKLLDFKRYLLYTNQSITQPRINFPIINKPTSSNVENVSKIFDLSKEENSSMTVEKPPSTVDAKPKTKTASDPNFLEEFYNNSRLHLISTLGAEFKQLVGRLREQSDGKFLGKERLIKEKGKQTSALQVNPVIMHIDMDCFFVSVALKNNPELKGKPLAVTHGRSGQIHKNNDDRESNREAEFALYEEKKPGVAARVENIDGKASMSEIASCSYEARNKGVRNGMFLGQAVKLCPDLIMVPYDFEGYKEVSNMLYKTIASYTLDIEAVSCDEMYVDITKILKESGLKVDEWARHIRAEIMDVTGCPCSTGFGANRLQARLSTRKAKPAGQFYLQSDDVESYMSEIPLSDLPGVGRSTLAKLRNLGLNTCGDVQVVSLKVLQNEIGRKAGETLKEQARGSDKKPLNFHQERKSVSAEVNYGIRFKTQEESYSFLNSLSKEVFSRLNDIGMRARCLTLKLLVRAADAPVETAKYLGHGMCDALSKSSTSNLLLNTPEVIFKEVKILYDKINPSFVDLRGVGIQLSKLEKNIAPLNNALSNFLNQPPNKKKENFVLKDKDLARQFEENVLSEVTSKNPEKIIIDEGIGESSNLKLKSFTRNLNQQDSEGKSKRGRPKGSKNSIKKNQTSCKTLSDFFEKKEKARQTNKIEEKKQQVSLTPQIDLNILKELPEDIRNEIIKEYKLENKIKNINPNTNVCTVKNGKSQTQIEQNKKEKQKENKKSDVNRKTHFSSLNWEEIKPIVKKWINSTKKPNQVDVEMIAEHFKELAVDRKIEVLRIAFNFLHRTLMDLNCDWHKAYFTIVEVTQRGMVARYGRTLLVRTKFDCCGT